MHVLRRAVDTVGGIGALARCLGMRPGVVMAMLDGRFQIPDWAFLKAADLINRVQQGISEVPIDPDRHEMPPAKQ